jgi:DedD protein
MAFFKFRKAGHEAAATRRQPETIETMRRRARHRLIGAVVLVLVGVIGFPLLFDTQPRPIAVDIPIEIPDRNKVKPLPAPPQPVTQAPAVSGPVTMAPPVSEPTPPPQEKVAAAPVAVKPEAKPETKPEPKTVAKAQPKAPAPADNGAKAKALLEGKAIEAVSSPAPTAAERRFVVQVGAFADPAKARETRLKVERAGLKTYTHVAQTKEGRRIRVRVGPFDTRAEADKAADRIKGLELPAAVLTL